MKKIHGICPTCYFTVTENQNHIKIGELTYHRDCEPMRVEFIKKNQSRWKEDGEYCKNLRVRNYFTITELAEFLGVSRTKLSNFEKGKPVVHARLLSMAYITYFRLYELEVNIALEEFKRDKAKKESCEKEAKHETS